MPRMLSIPAADGGSFQGYLAEPANRKGPGVLVIQEIFGINTVMRGICDDLARQGYFALCPDLFWRIEPGLELSDAKEAEMQKAFELFNQFDVALGMKDLLSTLAYARSFDSAKVGAVGYCLGGKLAYMMAVQSDADCVASYYGVGLEAMLGDVPKITHPLLMHIAEKDKFVDAAAREKILAAVKANPKIEAHAYPGVDHAFARINGINFNAEAAQLANGRTRDFVKKYLG